MNVQTNCRMCLSPCEDDQLKSMLTTWNGSINLWTMYDYVMNVGENDDSSASVPYSCLKCEKDLKSAYDFKVMCVETERTLGQLAKITDQSESGTEYVLYDDNDDDFIEEYVEVLNEDRIEVDVEIIEDNYIEEQRTGEVESEAVIDDEDGETKDKDLWDKSFEEIIQQDPVTGQTDSDLLTTKRVVHNCKMCNLQFVETKDYQSHYRQMHRGVYQRIYDKNKPRSCPTCNIQFENVVKYQIHYRQYHGQRVQLMDKNDKKVLCPCCGKLLARASVWKHVRNEQSKELKREHKCTVCGKIFKRLENLIMHKRIHTDDRRFECNICGEKFLHWASRRNHVALKHTGEKSYKCQYCDKKFTFASYLHQHIRRHRNELSHCCSICSKAFITKTELNDHQIVHTKVKTEVCEICQKCFGTRKNLKAHMRTHSGEKNYVCTVCDKRFTQPHVLRTHLKTHPGVEIPKRGVILSQKALLRLKNVSNDSVSNEN